MSDKAMKGHEHTLRRLMGEERKIPYTRLDQINTLIHESILGEGWEEERCQALLEILHRLLRTDPTLVAVLNRAIVEEGGDWIDATDDLLSPPEEGGIQALVEFIDEAEEASRARLAALGVDLDDTIHMVRVAASTAQSGRRTGYVAVDFLTGRSPRTCYDRTPFVTDDYPDFLLRLCVFSVPMDLQHTDEKSKPVQQGPMFAYHPERMRASRPYLKKLRPFGVREGKPSCAVEDLNEMAEAIQKDLREHHLDTPIKLAEESGERGIGFLFKEHDLAGTWLAYAGSGREIFDIPSRLADLFALSDCDDLQLSQVKTPYKAQYIHFGPREDLPLAPGWLCDGAYVINDAGAMTVRFTAMPADPEDLVRWRMRAEPVVMLAFEQEDQPLDIGTAVDTAVARQLGQLREEKEGAAQKQLDADAAIKEAGLEGSSVKVGTEKRVERETSELLASREVAHKALSLLVNSLCYLTAYPDDVEHRWPAAAPKGLVEQLEGGTPGRRRRAEQQLHAEGFSKIRLCGRKFRETAPLEHPDAGSVRSHWRRGHFRSQAHGPGRQLRKIVWIMPVLVNASTMTEDTQLPGHIYLATVDPETS